MNNRLRVFSAVNHVANEFETLKLAKKYPISWGYLENNVRRWSRFSARPEPSTWLTPEEFHWTTYFDPSEYDLAIIRIDQQHADAELGKAQLSRQLLKTIGDSIPVVIVNHGTPLWPEMFDEEMVKFGGQAQTRKGPRTIDGISELIKGATVMVVNSYEAVNRWQGVHPHIMPILHGLDPMEWPHELPKEPRVVLPVSPGGLDAYYNRALCTAIKSAVKERTGLDVMHPNVNIKFDGDNWSEYREFMGSSLISIFPFKDSPMPRSRTEAMLMSSCVLSSRYHGANEYIQHGVNGFIIPDNPLSYAEAIHLLVNEAYQEAVAIGQKGRETALDLFNIDRYLDDWWYIINEVANGRKPTWQGDKVWGTKL